MGRDDELMGTGQALTTQAIVELTEANLSTTSGESEWTEEVDFLRSADGADWEGITPAEVDEVLAFSTVMA